MLEVSKNNTTDQERTILRKLRVWIAALAIASLLAVLPAARQGAIPAHCYQVGPRIVSRECLCRSIFVSWVEDRNGGESYSVCGRKPA